MFLLIVILFVLAFIVYDNVPSKYESLDKRFK